MKNLFFASLLMATVTVLAQDPAYHLNKVYKMNPRGVIDLRVSDAKVFITGGAGEEARVKIDRKVVTKGLFYNSSNEFDVAIDDSNGDLRIRETKRTMNAGIITYWEEDYKIEIEAPAGTSLVVRADDGDYFIKNINGSISLTLDDADAELSDCNGDQFYFKMDDGDLRMNKGQGKLEIAGDDADITITNGSFAFIDADIDDGDLNIETSLADNGSYALDARDGQVALTVTKGGGEFDIRHDDASVSTNGNFTVNEDSETRTTVKLASGKAKVRISADDGRVKLSSSI